MQHLHELLLPERWEPDPDFDIMQQFLELDANEPFRKQDMMLFSAFAFTHINNLRYGLVKQAASTLFNGYNPRKDDVSMKSNILTQRLEKEHPVVYKALMETDNSKEIQILKKLRNQASHGDIAHLIQYQSAGNPSIQLDGEAVDLHDTLESIALKSLQLGKTFYNALTLEVNKLIPNPFAFEKMREEYERLKS